LVLQQTQERNSLMARLIEQSAALNRNYHVTEVLPAISRGVAELLHPDKVDIFLSEPAATTPAATMPAATCRRQSAEPAGVEQASTQELAGPDPRRC
jgi:hypothetical protein